MTSCKPPRKNRSTPEGKRLWDAAAKAAKEVATWPAWKRGDYSALTYACHVCGMEPLVRDEPCPVCQPDAVCSCCRGAGSDEPEDRSEP